MSTEPRTYVIGVPLFIVVNPDGKITYEVDLSEAYDIESDEYEQGAVDADRKAIEVASRALLDSDRPLVQTMTDELIKSRDEAILDDDGTLRCPENGCQQAIDRMVEEGYGRMWKLNTWREAGEIEVRASGDTFTETGAGDDHLVCPRGHESEFPAGVDPATIIFD